MIDIRAEFEPMIGLHTWRVKHGYGSFVTMEFGDPQLVVHETRLARSYLEGVPYKIQRRLAKPRGQWHLWIYCCDWEIAFDGVTAAHNESDDDIMERALRILDGQILTNVTVQDVARTSFEFDLGGVVTTWPSSPECYSGEAVELWYLYKPNKQVLSIRNDDHVSLGPGNRIPEETEWLPRTIA